MAVNSFFFDKFNSQDEQGLLDSLVVESIQIGGMDVFYIRRTLQSEDRILGEDRNPTFDKAYEIEMYIKTVDNFEGEGDLMSKFGFQMRDTMVLTVANTRFQEVIGEENNFSRPREGDLIYFPLNRKIWEIRHVEHEAVFYQLGKLYATDLKCELYEFSNEQFETGIAEIDQLAAKYNRSSAEIDTIEEMDAGAFNETFENAGRQVIDFSEKNIFGNELF